MPQKEVRLKKLAISMHFAYKGGLSSYLCYTVLLG